MVYDWDPDMALMWSDFLSAYGHSAAVKSMSELNQFDMSFVDLFIIDDNASQWDFVDAQLLYAYNKPILGVGWGILALMHGGSSLGVMPDGLFDYDGFEPSPANHAVFSTPYSLGLAQNGVYSVIPYGDPVAGLDLGPVNPAQVEKVAQAFNYPDESYVAVEGGMYAFWGWYAHDPITWTWEGQGTLLNLVEYLVN